MADALILGGGLAGSAAALLLAKGGKVVRLIERETGAHHKICGEFLSIDAYRHLADLGVNVEQMGAASIDRIQLVAGKRLVEAQLPFTAFGIGRYRLDEALIERAADAGVVVERGVRVHSLVGNHVRTSAGDREGRTLLLATGKHAVRNAERTRSLEENPFVGFKMHYRLSPTARRLVDRTIRLILFDGGYAGLQPIEDGKANLCLVIRRSRLAALSGNWEAVRSMLADLPHCGDVLADAEPLFSRPVAIANLNYGALPPGSEADGIFRLGDQAGMTASLTGDGMAIALRSAFIAACCLRQGLGAADYAARYRQETQRQMRAAMALQRLQESHLLRASGMSVLGLSPILLNYAARATRLPQWPH